MRLNRIVTMVGQDSLTKYKTKVQVNPNTCTSLIFYF